MEQLPQEVNGWGVEVASDLVWGHPHPEDGERREIEVFFVLLTGPTGRRFGSIRDFADRDAAWRCVPAVAARLRAGGSPIGSPHWHERHPMYGSEAYMDAEPEIVAMERRVDEEGTYYDGGIHGR